MSPSKRVEKTELQWREELTADQYEIARGGGTERAFSGKYYAHKEAGTYHCVCCHSVLFRSSEKYESGSGWPSFWDIVKKDCVTTRNDFSLGAARVEILCATCDAHLGHVFEDGPNPTGLRYCVNSACLDFSKRSELKD